MLTNQRRFADPVQSNNTKIIQRKTKSAQNFHVTTIIEIVFKV